MEIGTFFFDPWYLAPAGSVSDSPEEYRNVGVVGVSGRSLASDSPYFGAGPAEKYRNLFWEVISGAVSAFLLRQWIHCGPRIPTSILFSAQCLARQWLYVMRQFGAFGRTSRIFHVNEETRIRKSILSCSPASRLRSVHSRCFS